MSFLVYETIETCAGKVGKIVAKVEYGDEMLYCCLGKLGTFLCFEKDIKKVVN